VETTELPNETASAIEDKKQRRKESRAKFLDGIRESLGSVRHQLAFSPTEAAIVCGKSPTWGYRRIYDGTFRVTTEGGRLMIPASEIAHFLAGATVYNPQNGGEGDGGS
jgi:uncharacterized protein YbbK (DUF523 family)